MAYRRIAASAVVTAALVVGPVAVTGPVSAGPADPPIVLPAPSGPAGVGSTTLHLIDANRPDPWNPQVPRELMVTVTYPARDVSGYPMAHYLSTEAAPAVTQSLTAALHLPVEAGNRTGLRTNAHRGAPVVATADRSLPLVLFSPGASTPRFLGTGTAEDLASRGYVVVSIDHTFEAPAVEFPGGRVVPGIPMPDEPGPTQAWGRTALDARIADTSFVLDRLTALADGQNPDAARRTLPTGLGRAIDPSRVGMFGHSLGGFTAAEAMARDPRIGAGVNLDGMVGFGGDPGAAATQGLDRPMLLMSSPRVAAAVRAESSWNGLWDNRRGWLRELGLAGGGHYSFTDLASFVPPGATAAVPPLTDIVGTIPPERSTAAVRTYVAAMFDRFLRGETAPLLDRPDAAFPEVRFVR